MSWTANWRLLVGNYNRIRPIDPELCTCRASSHFHLMQSGTKF